MKAKPIAVRTLLRRPKKVVVEPKKGDESEFYCDRPNHEDTLLQHDGDGGYYCGDCDNECDKCGYCHHYTEKKCPTGKECEDYTKWREEPKRDEFSESFCEIHDDENLLHDGDGGLYCYSCDNSVLCVGCESVIQREEIYRTLNAGTLQEEFYCDYCCGPDTDDEDEDEWMEVYSYHHGFGSFCGEHEHLQPYRDFRYYQCWGGGPEGGYIECGVELYRVNRTWGKPFTVERVKGKIEEDRTGDKIRIIKK
jgi:hypothetical protein